MKNRFLFASVSVAALVLASAAYAGDNNQTNINQKGTNGSVTIDQSGNGNVAGASGLTSSTAPTISNSLVQDGTNETLSVTQSGNNNNFRGIAGDSSHPGSQVQSGSGNVANVTQSGTAGTVTLSQAGTGNGVFDQNNGPQFTPDNPINQI